MNERTYHRGVERLREPGRMALLEPDRVVRLACESMEIRMVLDVGTGTAIFAEAFARAGLAVAGIDISEEMLAAARRFVPGGDFRPGSMENIPFPDSSFDVVFLGHVLHEADDVATALTEAKRVAKKRVAVLEWPYVAEEMGPPLGHRLKPENIAVIAGKVGFTRIQILQLSHMVLIIMDVGAHAVKRQE